MGLQSISPESRGFVDDSYGNPKSKIQLIQNPKSGFADAWFPVDLHSKQFVEVPMEGRLAGNASQILLKIIIIITIIIIAIIIIIIVIITIVIIIIIKF